MAKDIKREDDDDDDDDNGDKMDNESLEFLEQVRKGKSRNFVLSVKGSKVRGLLIKKKKIKEGDKKEMRGQGYQPVFGVVTGMGANITFTLARSDGFEEAPGGGKVEKLKKFLVAQTGKAFKPSYEIVATPPAVPFDEDDLSHPLIAKFMKLEPLVDKAATVRPDQQTELEQRVSALRILLQDEDTIDSSGPKLDDFVLYLKELLANATSSPDAPAPPQADVPPVAPPAPPVSANAELAKKLGEGLKKLKPLLDQAIVAHPARKGELVASMAQIVGEIKAQQLGPAKENMVALGALLKGLLTSSAAGPAPNEDSNSDLTERLALVGEKLESVRGLGSDKVPTFEKILDMAAKQAAAGKPGDAQTALDKLESALDALLQPLMQFMQRWNDLSPSLGEATKKNPTAAAGLNFSYQSALEQAQAGQISVADQTLQKLVGDIQTAMDTAANTDTERFGIREGIVAEQREKLQAFFGERVKQAKLEAAKEVDKIESVVTELEADDDPKQLGQAIVGALNELYDDVYEALTSALNSESGDKVLSTAADWRKAVESSPLVQHLQSAPNELGANAQLLERFNDLFSDVEQRVNEAMVAN